MLVLHLSRACERGRELGGSADAAAAELHAQRACLSARATCVELSGNVLCSEPGSGQFVAQTRTYQADGGADEAEEDGVYCGHERRQPPHQLLLHIAAGALRPVSSRSRQML